MGLKFGEGTMLHGATFSFSMPTATNL